jgi:CubicO group peptidase (beta-lactamase class C family)
VTSRNEAEEDPRAAGLTRADIDRMWGVALKLYRSGLHPAVALCVRRGGKLVIDRAVGHVRGNGPCAPRGAEKVPVSNDTPFCFFSASKAVTAMLVHLLDERRLVHIDDPIAEYVPEFGRHGKDRITLKQVLTHRAGIPALRDVAVDLDLLVDRERLLSLLCDAEPIAVPGRRLTYHALTGGFLIDEVIRRVTGRDARAFLADEVLRPLGFRGFNYGVPADRVHEVAENAFTGLPPMPPTSWMLERVLGVGLREAVTLSNDPRFLTAIVPSGNVIGSAEEGCRFFELLRRGGELDGVRVFDRLTVRRAVAETSYLEVDSFLGLPVRYSVGLMLGGRVLSPYGRDTTEAFGHVGFTNVVAWADPARELSACLLTSGKPFVTPGQLRWIDVMWTIAKVCRPS